MPLRFNHQAVVRDLSGQVVAGQAIRLRVSLVQGVGIAATDRYVEIHQVVTNANGLFTLEVGGGSVVSGRMDSVEWALGQVYLRTEVDPTGGTNYLLSSNRELLSVPYALYAQQAQSASNIVGGGAGVLATVRTLGASVRYTGALVEGSLDSDGGELVLSRGVCVDTLPSPGTSKAVPHSGTGMGAYTVDLTGLTPGRTYHVRAYATTAAGTAFGQSLTLQTRALAVPAPVTLPATGLSAFGAQLRGELPDTSTGGLAVSSRGFRWSTASGFAPAAGQDLASQASAGTGYSAQVTGLSPSTNYYYRAYAVNALGTGYGQELSFSTGNQPLATVQTQAASSITQTQALVAGAVTADAGSAVSERGFCYSTQNSPSITSDTIRAGSGLGTFNGTLRNLTPNTTYYFRSYAVNGGGVAYGLVLSLQTPALALASIQTNPIYGISNASAYSGGTIGSDGGSSITHRGVVFDLVAGPTLTSNLTSDGVGTGSYTSIMTGLAPSTTYYVRAYANNALGTAYGNELSFNTTAQASGPGTVPIVGTQFVTKTDSNYVGGGNVLNDGNSPILSLGICWSRSSNPTIADSVIYFLTPGLGSFNLPFQLPVGCNENFYVRAFAVNSHGIGYGQEVSTTNGFLVGFGSTQIQIVSATSVSLDVNIINSGGCNIQERGICWSTNPNPTISNVFFKKNCGNGLGVSICNVDMLLPQTLYFFRPYAITQNGVFYGQQINLTTDTTSGLFIGKNYGGGIIFHIDSSGQHGLICSSNDYGGLPWGCPSIIGGNITNVSGTSDQIGTGAINTAFIVAACNDRPIAASFCADLILNGYSDWYLPSQGDLNLIYNRLVVPGVILNYSMCWHWSSTQHPTVPEWALLTSFCPLHDGRDFHLKWVTDPRIRPVRSF